MTINRLMLPLAVCLAMVAEPAFSTKKGQQGKPQQNSQVNSGQNIARPATPAVNVQPARPNMVQAVARSKAASAAVKTAADKWTAKVLQHRPVLFAAQQRRRQLDAERENVVAGLRGGQAWAQNGAASYNRNAMEFNLRYNNAAKVAVAEIAQARQELRDALAERKLAQMEVGRAIASPETAARLGLVQATQQAAQVRAGQRPGFANAVAAPAAQQAVDPANVSTSANPVAPATNLAPPASSASSSAPPASAPTGPAARPQPGAQVAAQVAARARLRPTGAPTSKFGPLRPAGKN
jgi:hypothetical protein